MALKNTFLVGCCLWAATCAGQVSGVVFEDLNGNGVQDPGERGIRNIGVSNGEEIVATAKGGRFVLRPIAGSSIFPIFPPEYRMSGSGKIKNTGFYYVKDSLLKVEALNFACRRQKAVRKFRLGAIGDVQVGNREEIAYANQTIMAELLGRQDLDLCIFLGDLVNNDMTLLPVLRDAMETLDMEVWTLPGNHDRDVAGQPHKQDSSYNTYFGASTYAFNVGEVHFIILNNVYPQGKKGYEGRLQERQLRFIENDLRWVSPEKLVVICQHIPLAHLRNRDRLLSLLKGRKVLALSGHTHQVGRVMLQDSVRQSFVHELVAGAVCGNWWVGEKDWQGIPTALMQCGTPRGYFVLDFEGSDYCFRYKGVGLDENRQMDIWIHGSDTLDRRVEAFRELPGNTVIANIYGGSDSTKVWMQVDQGIWQPMQRVKLVAPYVSRLNTWNKEKIYPTRISRRGALRQQASPHLWQGYLSGSLLPGIHTLRIRGEDRFGLKVEGQSTFFIESHGE